MLGVSLLIVSIVPLLRLVGLRDRLAYTAAGLALVVWWMLPLDAFEGPLGPMEMDFSIWVAGGLLAVVGATWLVTYNADVLLGAVQAVSSRLPSLAPVMKLAITYPLRDRFRTGVTLAMFMLVVFTLVTGTTISTAFINAYDDPNAFGGGYDVRASTPPALAIDDLRAGLAPDVAAQIEAVGSQSFLPLDAAQDGTGATPAAHPVRGLDDEFLDTNGFEMATMATGYRSADEVWQALRDDPTLAVVDPYVVPRRQNWGGGVLPELQLTGFFFEDASFDPVPVTVRDPQSGEELHLKVVGVLRDSIPLEMVGISVSQRALAPFGPRAAPTVHHVAVVPGADAGRVAAELESTYLANGLEAETYRRVLADAVGASLTFNRLVQGFMGLGLFVGVAALGVISARAVVERRQQIGVLRAIGFQPEMIRRTLLLESSFISGTAIVVGSALGLLMSYNVIADASQRANNSNVGFDVPWLNLARGVRHRLRRRPGDHAGARIDPPQTKPIGRHLTAWNLDHLPDTHPARADRRGRPVRRPGHARPRFGLIVQGGRRCRESVRRTVRRSVAVLTTADPTPPTSRPSRVRPPRSRRSSRSAVHFSGRLRALLRAVPSPEGREEWRLDLRRTPTAAESIGSTSRSRCSIRA